MVIEPVFQCNSNWEPKKNHHDVEAFVEAVEYDVKIMLQGKNKLPRNNLSEKDKVAMNCFTKGNDIVITKADKGGVTVDREEYLSRANQQRTEKILFKKLNEDPITKQWYCLSSIYSYPFELLKDFLQTRLEYHNFIF